jgi:hypothetical protein
VCVTLLLACRSQAGGFLLEMGVHVMDRDRLGRRRSPEQERGLRPLHPPLPEEWISKALRVAMSESDWERFQALVDHYVAATPSQARACGIAISTLLQSAQPKQPDPVTFLTAKREVDVPTEPVMPLGTRGDSPSQDAS